MTNTTFTILVLSKLHLIKNNISKEFMFQAERLTVIPCLTIYRNISHIQDVSSVQSMEWIGSITRFSCLLGKAKLQVGYTGFILLSVLTKIKNLSAFEQVPVFRVEEEAENFLTSTF